MRQNLVFIMTDQQRADTLGMVSGNTEVTPALNQLSGESTVFERAYNTCPLCVPARTALATGMNPIKNGMMLNDLPGKYARDNETIHQMLYKAGYEVAHVGVNHISIKPGLKDSIPFAVWEDDDTYAAYAKEHDLTIQRRDEDSVVVDELADGEYARHRYSNARTSIWPYDLSDFKDVWFTSKAEEFIRSKHEKPFALFLYMWAPHPPLIVPQEYWDLFQNEDIVLPPGTGVPSVGEPEGRRKGAAAQLGNYPPEEGWKQGWHAHLSLSRLCDDQIGRIRNALKETGLDESTMLVFTTDHGEHMGQHSMYQKMEMYEQAVRVPAVFHMPGQTKDQARNMKTAISHMDFVPTLVDLFDLTTKNNLDGVSLRKSLETGTEPEEKDIFGVYCGNHQFGDMRRMIVSGSYKYIYDNKDEELYDLKSDPWEQNNLCLNPDYREISDEMYHKLENWAKEQKDEFFQPRKK